MNGIKELTDKVIRFRDERNWKQFHNPKDLALSLSLEASELLENFQWKESDEAILENKDKMEEELADVLIYSMLIANELELDIYNIVNKKLIKNEMKYPVNKAYGSKAKYTDL
ncbi:nucleotide pyrophosphohydrolase [Niallia circulans]|uniref:nucleotide pyrophosphohydrolase n=1 Tax=Niallia circulans TaxID=1397 RepID=UPI0015CEB88E|nr:nucleotide pyrophosphohydrolase [Niallia circulans]